MTAQGEVVGSDEEGERHCFVRQQRRRQLAVLQAPQHVLGLVAGDGEDQRRRPAHTQRLRKHFRNALTMRARESATSASPGFCDAVPDEDEVVSVVRRRLKTFAGVFDKDVVKLPTQPIRALACVRGRSANSKWACDRLLPFFRRLFQIRLDWVRVGTSRLLCQRALLELGKGCFQATSHQTVSFSVGVQHVWHQVNANLFSVVQE
mmetsp:Transcript_26372/g.87411  ORF Transcript_26372/g.87411 Transcript_26372/m.87411 type:complete len:206 (+) Transcript_26372:1077-1694(+)